MATIQLTSRQINAFDIHVKRVELRKKMKRFIQSIWVTLVFVTVWSCKPKDPTPGLPAYLTVPSTLAGYEGSGLITVDGGGLALRAEGAERLDASTQTYTGVTGNVSGEDMNAYFTVSQPRSYRDRRLVPNQYWAYGNLSIRQTTSPGTYRMGIQASPGPRGEIADLTLNLPGPQLYVTNSGSLTISESTLIKTDGSYSLYRIRGTFQAVMYADGVGIPSSGRNPTLNGTFDVLFVKN